MCHGGGRGGPMVKACVIAPGPWRLRGVNKKAWARAHVLSPDLCGYNHPTLRTQWPSHIMHSSVSHQVLGLVFFKVMQISNDQTS